MVLLGDGKGNFINNWTGNVIVSTPLSGMTNGIIGLGRFEVRGRSREPSPPAMMTAFMPAL